MTPRKPPDSRVLAGLHILVVDGNLDECDALDRTLGLSGAEVHAVHCATDALTALDTIQVDVLISDIPLPDCDGYDLIKTVRRRNDDYGAAVPAIAASGWARTLDHADAYAAGFNAYVAKPYSPDQLVRVIAMMMPLDEFHRDLRARGGAE
jgi:two-component system, OmpR family, response regulator